MGTLLAFLVGLFIGLVIPHPPFVEALRAKILAVFKGDK